MIDTQPISASVAMYEKEKEKKRRAKKKNTFRQPVSRLRSFHLADNDFLRYKRNGRWNTGREMGGRRGGREGKDRDVITAFVFDFI